MIADSTGPKISSRAIDICGRTPSNMVGSTIIAAAVRPYTLDRRSASLRAVAAARLDVAEHALHLSLIDDRAELRRRIERITGLHGRVRSAATFSSTAP